MSRPLRPSNRDQRETTTEAQIQRLVELLRSGKKDTHYLRRMGISHPAGRVQDLLKRGCEVTSSRITTVDSDGYSHSGVALYDLVSEPGTANSNGANRQASLDFSPGREP